MEEHEHFKKIDRIDRKREPQNRKEKPKSTPKTEGIAPNPNSDSHKPKIVPWK